MMGEGDREGGEITMSNSYRQWAIIIPGRGIGTSQNYTSEAEVWKRQDFPREFLEKRGYRVVEVEINVVI